MSTSANADEKFRKKPEVDFKHLMAQSPLMGGSCRVNRLVAVRSLRQSSSTAHSVSVKDGQLSGELNASCCTPSSRSRPVVRVEYSYGRGSAKAQGSGHRHITRTPEEGSVQPWPFSTYSRSSSRARLPVGHQYNTWRKLSNFAEPPSAIAKGEDGGVLDVGGIARQAVE